MRLESIKLGLAAAAVGAAIGFLTLGTAWTAPRTWVFDELVTESIMNTHIRDNMLHIKENLNASKGFARNLVIRSHPNSSEAANKIQLHRLDQAVFDSGLGKSSLPVTTADISASGENGLDTGSEQASTWYEIWGIHKSTLDTFALVFHRAKDWLLDETYDSDDSTYAIRHSSTNRTAWAQGFKIDTAGYIDFIDVELIRVGAVTGQIWAELQTNSSGLPSNSVLATSDKMDAALISTSAQKIRFLFRTPVSLASATQYHLVLTGDWTQSDTVYIGWRGDASAATYANGDASKKDAGTWVAVTDNDMSFWMYVRRNETSVTMPAGYDGKILLGYAYNDGSSNLRPFQIWDRMYVPLSGQDIGSPSGSGTVPTLVDMAQYVPPVQITFTFWLRNGADSSWDIRIGPVPSGYDAVNAGHRNAGVSRFDGSINSGIGGDTLSVGQRMEPIVTETQALYVRAGAGTINALVVSSWEW